MAYLVQGKAQEAYAAYSVGMDQFGADGARQTRAAERLRALSSQGVRTAEASKILKMIESMTR